MTHTPTLPNGFSRDFSEAPEGVRLFCWIDAGGINGAVYEANVFKRYGDNVRFPGGVVVDASDPGLLCWCPIPGES